MYIIRDTLPIISSAVVLCLGKCTKYKTTADDPDPLTQGEGHNGWGNAPKKSNSAICAHFVKTCIYT